MVPQLLLPQACTGCGGHREGGQYWADESLQRAVSTLLRKGSRRAPELRMRQKLEVWQMPLFPRHRAARATAMLNRLAELTELDALDEEG